MWPLGKHTVTSASVGALSIKSETQVKRFVRSIVYELSLSIYPSNLSLNEQEVKADTYKDATLTEDYI